LSTSATECNALTGGHLKRRKTDLAEDFLSPFSRPVFSMHLVPESFRMLIMPTTHGVMV
jgi:hypothetical protein